MSQLTTHILDTTRGKPAAGVHVILYRQKKEDWIDIAKGITNQDGRIADLLQKNKSMEFGTYKLRFETLSYFTKQSIQSFYPFIEIIFHVTTTEHYHVPLLLNPYGYSTYRGS
jgi:5-hydroxyisourate hydrolase